MTRNQKAYRELINGVWHRQCTDCYRTLPETLEHFYINSQGTVCAKCIDCYRIYDHKRYTERKKQDGWMEKRREQWRKNHPGYDELTKLKRRLQRKRRSLSTPTGRETKPKP